MMVAKAWQASDQRGDCSFPGDPQYPPAFEDTAFRDIKFPSMKRYPGPGPIAFAAGDFDDSSGFDLQKARHRPNLAISVTGFDDVRGSLLVKSDAGWKGQVAGD